MAEERWKTNYHIKWFLSLNHEELRKLSLRTLRLLKGKLTLFDLREKFKDRYQDLLLAIEEKQNYRQPTTPGVIELIRNFFSQDKNSKLDNKKEEQSSLKEQKYWETDDNETPLLAKYNKQ